LICITDTGVMDEMETIANELAMENGIETMAVGLDVCGTASVEAMAKAVKERFGRVDILCNNAGAAFGVPSTLANYDESKWLKTMDVNLNGAYTAAKAGVIMFTKVTAAH